MKNVGVKLLQMSVVIMNLERLFARCKGERTFEVSHSPGLAEAQPPTAAEIAQSHTDWALISHCGDIYSRKQIANHNRYKYICTRTGYRIRYSISVQSRTSDVKQVSSTDPFLVLTYPGFNRKTTKLLLYKVTLDWPATHTTLKKISTDVTAFTCCFQQVGEYCPWIPATLVCDDVTWSAKVTPPP